MDIKDLKSFQAVYELKSINRAAKKLYITPQGLGSNIKALEKELDTILFERDKQGAKPTSSADLLYKKANAFIKQFEEIQNELHQLKNQAVKMKIGFACGTFHVLPFKVIERFITDNLSIQVEWCEYSNAEVKQLLVESKIDYGFIVGDWEEENMQKRKIASTPLYLLMYKDHPYWDYEAVNLDLLREEKLLLLNEHFNMFHDFKKACQMRGFVPHIVAKTADVSSLYKLCRQKIGVAVITGFVLNDFNMTNLKAIPFEEAMCWEVYGTYKKEHQHYAVIEKFEEFLSHQEFKGIS